MKEIGEYMNFIFLNSNDYKKNLIFCYEQFERYSDLYSDNKVQIENIFTEKDLLVTGKKISFRYLTKKEKEVCSSIIDLCFLLIDIKFKIDKFEKCLDLCSYEKIEDVAKGLSSRFYELVCIYSKIEEYVYEKYKVSKEMIPFEFNTFFRPFFGFLKKYLDDDGRKKMDRQLRWDIEFLRCFISSYQFLFPFYLTLVSPFFTKKQKKISYTLLETLLKLINRGTIQYLQIQEKQITDEFEKRNNRSGTTRILGIFARRNEDLLLFRLDFPHPKEESVHLNISEQVGNNLKDTGYPYSKKEIDTLGLKDSVIDNLFYQDRMNFWPRTSIIEKLNNESLKLEERKKIKELMRSHSHYEIFSRKDEKKVFNFIEKIKYFFNFFDMDYVKIEDFDRQEKQNIAIIQNIRKEFFCREVLAVVQMDYDNLTDEEIMKINNISEKRLAEIRKSNTYQNLKKKYFVVHRFPFH